MVMVLGCDRKTDSDAVVTDAFYEPLDIPDDWPQISLSRAEVDGVLNLTLSGKKKSLKEVMQTVGESLSKPVRFEAGVDVDRMSEEFDFRVDEGSWGELLKKIAVEFDCAVEETDAAFVFTQKE